MTQANDRTTGIPADPSGIDEPHDVLAAEEFAMPAPGDAGSGPTSPAEAARHPAAIAGLVALLVLLFVIVKRRG
jgi:hypothetical protein